MGNGVQTVWAFHVAEVVIAAGGLFYHERRQQICGFFLAFTCEVVTKGDVTADAQRVL